ncbi:MAG TPA: sugar transferase [Thermoanaerobaculia bacterium]|jgi:putative colanic acid biosynthesis UDP-glucose lipid carrier transferase|nr:sugar transferase [Thermoanaerobaculia bacterium]
MHPMGGSRGWRARRYVGDGLAALVAWYGAVLLRVQVSLPLTHGLLPAERIALVHPVTLLVLALQLLTLYFFGFYYSPEPRPRLELASRLLGAAVLQGLLLTAYFFLADRSFPRSVLLLYVFADWLLLVTWRGLAQRLYRPRRRRVALVGCGAAALELAAKIARHHWHGLDVVGHLHTPEDPPPGETASEPLGRCLGTIDDVPALLRGDAFDDLVVVAPTHTWQSRLVDRLAGARPDRIAVLLLPGPFESLIGRMRYRWVSDLPLIEVMSASEWRLHRPLKRLLDLLGAGLLLVLLLPATLLTALAVRLSSSGPVLYRQTRVGRAQQPFTLLKFRTMRQGAEQGEELLATPGDSRLTPIGALLRRTRLDELPQLLNVLGGTMSLVGPRPERPGFVRAYLERVPGYAERFSLRPGLTGLAQVNGDYDSTPENKLRYDLAYMANWSLWLDLSILVRTVRTVLSSRGV